MFTVPQEKCDLFLDVCYGGGGGLQQRLQGGGEAVRAGGGDQAAQGAQYRLTARQGYRCGHKCYI